MTVADIPRASVDLAPGLPSRIVYGTVLAPTEDRGVKGAWIEVSIPGEVKVPGQETTVTGRSARIPLNVDGTFAVRLPTAAAGIEPEDWALSVRMSWRPVAFPMRVPVGVDPIWIEDCVFPELVPGEDPSKYFLSGAQIRSVDTLDPDEPARVNAEIVAGVLTMDLGLPRGQRGLPGPGAVAADEAVAGYVEAGTDSLTGTALRESFAARDHSATASATAVTHYVSPSGDDTTGDGTEANPFKTINYAASLVPDVVRHQHSILLLPGEYPEDVRLANKVSHGVIRLGGATPEPELYRVRKVIFDRVQGQAYMQNMVSTVADTEGERSFEFRGSGPMMFATRLVTTPDEGGPMAETRGLLADYGSTVSVSNCDFSGKRYGVRSNYQSQVFLSSNNTGTGNHIGVAARWGGRLNAHYGGLPAGATAMSTNSGGVISLGSGQVVGDIEETGLVRHEDYRQQGWTQKVFVVSPQSIPSTWIPDADIPERSTVRLRFRAPGDNVQYKVTVEWLARTGLTGAQAAEVKTSFLARQGSFMTESTHLVHSLNMGNDPVDVHPRGSNFDFYVDITGVRAMRGEWSGRVTIDSSVGKLPIFAEASLL